MGGALMPESVLPARPKASLTASRSCCRGPFSLLAACRPALLARKHRWPVVDRSRQLLIATRRPLPTLLQACVAHSASRLACAHVWPSARSCCPSAARTTTV